MLLQFVVSYLLICVTLLLAFIPLRNPMQQRSSCISDRPSDNQETPLLFEISDTAPLVISASNSHRSQAVRMDIDDTSNCTSGICKLDDDEENTISFVAQSVSPDGGNNLKGKTVFVCSILLRSAA